jgi:citrate/tricarballylate utilization protein
MPALLVVHLGIVLALFVTLPYGKFVHGMYRTAALVKFAREESETERQPIAETPDSTIAAAVNVDVLASTRGT